MSGSIQTGKINSKLSCPHCKAFQPHLVVRRLSQKAYHWDHPSEEYFKMVYNVGLQFRERTRQCSSCGKLFDVVEMSKTFLAKLINDVMQKREKVHELRMERVRLKAELVRTKAAMRSVRRLITNYETETNPKT